MLPRTKSEEQLYAEMNRGVTTARMMDIILPVVNERQAELVKGAIMGYRSTVKPYTPEQALLFVASLAANQDIIDRLDRIVADGQKAGQHFAEKS